jgi:acetolactate synthase small subunit
MKRLITLIILAVLILGITAYFLYGPATIKRLVVGAVEDYLIQILGRPMSPTRRLERAGLVVEEQQAILQRRLTQITGELAASEQFQQQLEAMIAQLENSDRTPETEVLLAKLRLFQTYRQQWKRLAELRRKIEQAVVAAQIAEVAGSTEQVDEIVRQVETEIKYTRYLLGPESEPIPLPGVSPTTELLPTSPPATPMITPTPAERKRLPPP